MSPEQEVMVSQYFGEGKETRIGTQLAPSVQLESARLLDARGTVQIDLPCVILNDVLAIRLPHPMPDYEDQFNDLGAFISVWFTDEGALSSGCSMHIDLDELKDQEEEG